MTPTNELRFVERPLEIVGVDPSIKRNVRVLQQKWALYWSEEMGGGERESEWLDVPIVKETL